MVDILMLRSPIFEVLYSPELDFQDICMASVLSFVLDLLGFFGCTHIFTIHLVYS